MGLARGGKREEGGQGLGWRVDKKWNVVVGLERRRNIVERRLGFGIDGNVWLLREMHQFRFWLTRRASPITTRDRLPLPHLLLTLEEQQNRVNHY